jgi:prophage antirepressor-like protein
MEIIPYDYSGKTIQIIIDKRGDPWRVAIDVCRALGLSNPTEALRVLDDHEKNALRIS